jgi:hypothetical protein
VNSLPTSESSLLVRTDFTDDSAWRHLSAQATHENVDGFRAYVEVVDDPAFDEQTWQAVRSAVPRHDSMAAVLFVADHTALSSTDRPILVVSLADDVEPFRCIPSELWGVDNNLNLANMDWDDFSDATDEDGVFRGFPAPENRPEPQ